MINDIHCSFKELESLGYSGFAMAFSGMDLQTVNTSDSAVCASHDVVDYIWSLIVASMFYYNRLDFTLSILIIFR